MAGDYIGALPYTISCSIIKFIRRVWLRNEAKAGALIGVKMAYRSDASIRTLSILPHPVQSVILSSFGGVMQSRWIGFSPSVRCGKTEEFWFSFEAISPDSWVPCKLKEWALLSRGVNYDILSRGFLIRLAPSHWACAREMALGQKLRFAPVLIVFTSPFPFFVDKI